MAQVYVTILASLPSAQTNLRSSINRNLTEIIDLHEGILGDLHRVVSGSKYTRQELDKPKNPVAEKPRHQRWRSLDAVPENQNGAPWLQGIPTVASDPLVAAEVAKVFARKVTAAASRSRVSGT